MSAPTPIQLRDPLVGTVLDGYQVLEPIGEGGTGVVYRGVHPVIGKKVAIKVLKASAAGDAEMAKRFISEAQSVNSIGHRNIIDIFRVGHLPDGRPYVVMEFLEGEPLDASLRRWGPPSVPEAVQLLINILVPLQAAHAAGVIHRDLKPSNIFVCKDPDGAAYVKLLDFGLAMQTEWMPDAPTQPGTNVVAGTPSYMAPEQAQALDPVPQTDLYSLGVVAFELFTGSLPFVGETPFAVLQAHISEPIPQPSQMRPELPPFLNGLVVSLLQKDPNARPASAELVRLRLTGWVAKLNAPAGTSGKHPTVAATKPKPSAGRRGPLVAGIIGAGVLAGALVGAVQMAARAKATPPPPPPPVVFVAPPPPVEPAPEPEAPPEAAPADPLEGEDLEPLHTIAPTSAKAAAAKPVRRAPTAASVTARLSALEKELRKRTPKGEEVDATALALIRRYRLVLTTEPSAATLLELDTNCTSLEKTFVAPLRAKN